MSGKISSRRRHMSTKQCSGNKCGDVPTKIQTSIYAMDDRDWPGKQRLAEHQACRCNSLAALFASSQAFLKAYFIYILFFKWIISFFQNGTLLCRQNRIFVDMSYFLKIAVLSPILSTKGLSMTALKIIEIGWVVLPCQNKNPATQKKSLAELFRAIDSTCHWISLCHPCFPKSST